MFMVGGVFIASIALKLRHASELIAGFIDLLLQRLTRPSVAIIDDSTLRLETLEKWSIVFVSVTKLIHIN